MRLCRRVALCAALILCSASADTQEVQPVVLQADGTIKISGRALKCGTVRNLLDERLPNLGISVPGGRLLVLNPALLARQPEIVRLFVFHHECGHQYVGASELDADCWAVRRGVQGGWLSKTGLLQVCTSFRGVPPTPTHPSGVLRCRNLERCFAVAIAKKTKQMVPSATPKRLLVSKPRLVRNGALR